MHSSTAAAIIATVLLLVMKPLLQHAEMDPAKSEKIHPIAMLTAQRERALTSAVFKTIIALLKHRPIALEAVAAVVLVRYAAKAIPHQDHSSNSFQGNRSV